MKTTYAILAIIATTLFSQNAMAKLGENRFTLQLDNNTDLNIEAEIVDNISKMLANVQAPAIKTDIAKQLNLDTVQSQTNEMVQNAAEKLPEFKFKVVIAD
jgi:hypothetical protein